MKFTLVLIALLSAQATKLATKQVEVQGQPQEEPSPQDKVNEIAAAAQ